MVQLLEPEELCPKSAEGDGEFPPWGWAERESLREEIVVGGRFGGRAGR